MERAIVSDVIAQAIAGGFTLLHNDGDGGFRPIEGSHNELLAKMFTVDDMEYLQLVRDGKSHGWLQFVYGNSGYDVISDCTNRLEQALPNLWSLSQKLEAQHA